MNTYADKTQENKSRSVANQDSQNKSGCESTFQFVDNRQEATTQRKLQEVAHNSPRVKQLRAFQEMANNSPQAKQVAQLLVNTNNDSAIIQKRKNLQRPPAQATEKRTINKYGGVLSQNIPATSKPVQLVMQYGNTHTLQGAQGPVHWHYSYDDANVNSLHLTIADTQNYNNRTWASRQSYNPTGMNTGNWTNWVNNHGQTPAWAIALAGNQGRGPAEQAFHADVNITAALTVAFPPPPLNLQNLAAFPPLPGAVAQAPALNPNAPAFVPQGQQQQIAPAMIGGIPANDAQHMLGSLLNDL